MKTITKTTLILAAIVSAVLFSCKKENGPAKQQVIVLPVVTTDSIYCIGPDFAMCEGTVTPDSGSDATAYGVCWSTKQDPTTTDNVVNINTNHIGKFDMKITGLSEKTAYYARVYATNSAGTAYGRQINFTTISKVVDYDGNLYTSVPIGKQLWLIQNLKTTHYNNGDAIPNDTGKTEWDTITKSAYCNYNNDTAMATIYGRLYNWYVVIDKRGVCPVGWHVPSDTEWHALALSLDPYALMPAVINNNNDKIESTTAGAALKAKDVWGGLSENATNSSGFTALPGGVRSSYESSNFDGNGIGGFFYCWSITEYSTLESWSRYMTYGTSIIYRTYIPNNFGNSIRCVKD